MKLSDQDKIDVVNKYLNGISAIKLAEEYHITRQSVVSILKVRGVNIRGKK